MKAVAFAKLIPDKMGGVVRFIWDDQLKPVVVATTGSLQNKAANSASNSVDCGTLRAARDEVAHAGDRHAALNSRPECRPDAAAGGSHATGHHNPMCGMCGQHLAIFCDALGLHDPNHDLVSYHSDDGEFGSDEESSEGDDHDDHGHDHDAYSVDLVALLSRYTNHRCQHEAKHVYNGRWSGSSQLALESPPPPPQDTSNPDFCPRECCHRALRAEITHVETRTVPAEWWLQRARQHARRRERRHEAACHALADVEGEVSVAWLVLAQVSGKNFGARDAESPMFAARVLAARQERIAARAYDVATYSQDVEAAMLCFVRADVARVVLGESRRVWPDRALVDRALGFDDEHRRAVACVVDTGRDLVERFEHEMVMEVMGVRVVAGRVVPQEQGRGQEQGELADGVADGLAGMFE